MVQKSQSKSTKKLEVKGYSGIYNCHKYWGKKPVELYELIIDEFTDERSLVCDPFMGSGVLPSVCKAKGINFDGCDLNPAALDVARMFIDPPSKQEVTLVLEQLRSFCHSKINDTYTLRDGTVISHIVWNEGKLDELWTKVKRSTHLVTITGQVEDEIKFKLETKLNFFKDRELSKNSRINVAEGQKVSDLFTKRGLQNIDTLLGGISKLNERQQKIARFILSSFLGQMSLMVFTIANRRRGKKEISGSEKKYEVGSWVIGYWRPKTFFEINVWQVFEGRATRLINSVSDGQLKLFPEKLPSSRISLSCDDAVGHLRKMKPKSIDLLVTDPPHSDRIPYLELSEMWNTILGYTSNLESEFIYSNSSKRKKSLSNYLEKFEEVIEQTGRVLKDGGVFILIFNTTDAEVWSSIKKFIGQHKNNLQYLGRFSADYSAGSVVQDSRDGSLVNDWCLVISRGQPKIDFSSKGLPAWTNEWISSQQLAFSNMKN